MSAYAPRFELFISTHKAYIYLDEKPYGCAEFDTGMVPSGEVAVTYGNVIYHGGADDGVRYFLEDSFLDRQTIVRDTKHFSYVGFSSGVGLPPGWPATLPCAQDPFL
jgi:hypothetical protein